ncbi:unnamed protein product, partial [Mycena citricolor]
MANGRRIPDLLHTPHLRLRLARGVLKQRLTSVHALPIRTMMPTGYLHPSAGPQTDRADQFLTYCRPRPVDR